MMAVIWRSRRMMMKMMKRKRRMVRILKRIAQSRSSGKELGKAFVQQWVQNG